MRKLFATLTRLEGSLVNVLINGESGVRQRGGRTARCTTASRVANGPRVVRNSGR